MSGTRSASRKAQATDTQEAVLIAFGSPSAPEPPERAIGALTREVGALLPGWRLRGATIAAEGSVERAFAGLSPEAMVLPLLMTDGWILRRLLTASLREAGRANARLLAPLGLLPAFTHFLARTLEDAIAVDGLEAGRSTVVLAAHGSARGPRPGAWARALCATLEARLGLLAVQPGLLEEPPFLADALRDAPAPALCLPCFVVEAYHAGHDVPQAVQQAGFGGRVLPPVGTHPGLVSVIATALLDQRPGLVAA